MIVFWEHTVLQPGVWTVRFDNFEGGYELIGALPIQAVGSIEGVDFVFSAQRDAWDFETNDEQGWLFPPEDIRAFQRQGKFEDASEMPFATAAKIIAECVGEFIEQ